MANFALDVAAFAKKAGLNTEKVVKNTAMGLYGAVIMSTPVNQNPLEHGGRARNNWMAAGSVPASGTVTTTDESGRKAVAEMESFIRGSVGVYEFTLTNNLPYIATLEFGGYPNPPEKGSVVSKPGVKPVEYKQFSVGGYSDQAPQGMVRVNAARFEALLEKEAAKARNS